MERRVQVSLVQKEGSLVLFQVRIQVKLGSWIEGLFIFR